MNTQSIAVLETLRDLEGVVGSFLIAENGGVVAQDLPSYFGSAAYDVAPRAKRLSEALTMGGGNMTHCIVRYGSHKLSLRPVGTGILTILAVHDVNLPALRMAMNLVAKKLAVALAAESAPPSTPPPPTVRPLSRAPVPPPEPPRSMGAPEAAGSRPHKKRPVYFRGKRVQ